MAKYTALTDKQKKMLEPLEKEVKEIMRREEFLKKKLAFKLSIGFEEDHQTREELAALAEKRSKLSMDISTIYNAHSDMMAIMMDVVKNVKIIDKYIETYGFTDVYEKKEQEAV